MKKTAITAIFMILCTVAIPAADYEVTIDGKTYLLTEGVEQQVRVKNGQQMSIMVSTVKIKDFQEHGISFRYPRHAKLSQENIFGIQQITLETTDSPLFLVQIYPGSVSPERAQQDLLAGFRDEFSKMGAKFPEEPTQDSQRSVGGKILSGVQLSYALGSLPHETEIYTLKHDDKTVALIFQHALEDKSKAEPLFTMIAESFK